MALGMPSFWWFIHFRFDMVFRLKRVEKLGNKPLGYRLATNTVPIGPTILWHVPGTKHHVDDRKMDGKILVDCLFLDSMMPVVKPGSHKDVLQKPKGYPQVRVNKNRCQVNKKRYRHTRLVRQSRSGTWE